MFGNAVYVDVSKHLQYKKENMMDELKFKNKQELWQWLIDGNVVESIMEAVDHKDIIYLKDGNPVNGKGDGVTECLLSVHYWQRSGFEKVKTKPHRCIMKPTTNLRSFRAKVTTGHETYFADAELQQLHECSECCEIKWLSIREVLDDNK